MVRCRPVLIVSLALAVPATLASQGRAHAPAPFSTIALSVAGVEQAGGNRELDAWDPNPGIELRALFPFYAGSAEIGFHQQTFASRLPGIPGFRGRFIFAGWGWDVRAMRPLRPLRPLRLRVGLRVGMYDFQFDDASLPPYSRNENEIATSLGVEAGWTLGNGWEVVAAGRGRMVMTEPRMRQVVLAAGLGRRFTTPAWLREFLD
ncbi:MAG TPA: hypothetical protein VK012_04865 [Gemmatimonadales bacterium]|nr:hypothetical protein [Gemmatimonadales bacterium]